MTTALKTDDGQMVIVSGRSRSGKTAWTWREVREAGRLIVWDPEDQWSGMPGMRRVSRRPDLLAACEQPGRGRLAYVPSGDLKSAFDFWAGCAYHWGRYYGECTVVAEELADVTSPGKAPGSWGLMVRRGLKRGISIFAISQRWAEADKTVFGNASRYALFAMSSLDDARYLARKTRATFDEMSGLTPEYWDDDAARPKTLPMIEVTATGDKLAHRFEFSRAGKMSFR
jgi:hypothetical protein